MKIVIITFTQNRLLYTKYCFGLLKQKAGYPYRHIVVDNGSTDSTYEWLIKKGYEVIRNEENLGISEAFKQAVALIDDCDLLIKFDNDCELDDDDTIKTIVDFYEQNGLDFFISPQIYGLNNPVKPRNLKTLGDYTFGTTGFIGGIFAVMPYKYVKEYIETIDKPGIDLNNSGYFISKGCQVGYLMDLSANHYETTQGQKERWGEEYHSNYRY